MKRKSDDLSIDCCSPATTKCIRQFDVWPITRFERKFPYFRMPSEIGSFSLDGSREFVDGRSHLRVYSPPSGGNIAWDLSHGYSAFVQRDESKKEYIDHLLQWIQLHRPSNFPSSNSDTDFCKDYDDKSM